MRMLSMVVTVAAFMGPRAARAAGAAASTAAAASATYWTIPIVAGLLNWATNRLAILMMFYPLKFRGYRRTGVQLGWQGIVPGKARMMANKIVDDVVARLIDLKVVFGRLPPERIADALEPLYVRVGTELTKDLLKRKGFGLLSGQVVKNEAFQSTLRTRGRTLVADFVRDVQAEPAAVFDLREVVVRGFSSDPRVLVGLFERCGDKDLKFVVNSGLVLGGALGVLQMLLWMVWSPWWSLALTGAAVGMVTDQLALNLIFLPVEPRKLGPFTLQGLFLKRQDEVSAQFAEFVAARDLHRRAAVGGAPERLALVGLLAAPRAAHRHRARRRPRRRPPERRRRGPLQSARPRRLGVAPARGRRADARRAAARGARGVRADRRVARARGDDGREAAALVGRV